MKVMMYGMPLISAWFAYIVPAAVGFTGLSIPCSPLRRPASQASFTAPPSWGEGRSPARRAEKAGRRKYAAGSGGQSEKIFGERALRAPAEGAERDFLFGAEDFRPEEKKGKGGLRTIIGAEKRDDKNPPDCRRNHSKRRHYSGESPGGALH